MLVKAGFFCKYTLHNTRNSMTIKLNPLSAIIFSSCAPLELLSIRNRNHILYHIFTFNQF